MNILLSGGAGFIGSNIADEYINLGHRVVIIDDFYSGRKKNIPEKAVFIEMDIREKRIEKVFIDYNIDFVSHQAARGDVRGSVQRPGEYADVNITGGINLLECCRKYKVRGIIYSSTGGCVYGEPKYIPTDENHPMQPRDPYGASKASFELYLETYYQLYGLGYTIFRYPNVYGPRQNPFGEAGVVSIFATAMLKNEKVVINGNGDQERDFVYIDDVVKANLLATEKNSNTIYNLGSGVGISVNTIFAQLKNITKYDRDPIYGPPKEGEVLRSVLSGEKILRDWDWKPKTELIYGLQKTVEYISKNEI